MDDLTAKYRQTFACFDGEVLKDILFNVCKFSEPFRADDEVRIAGFNLAMSILARMGVMVPGNEDQITRALMSVVPPLNTGREPHGG